MQCVQADKTRVAEQRYRQVFEHANDAITLLSPEGIILEANERWRTLIGIDPAELVGRSIGEFAPAGSETSNIEQYKERVLEGAGRTAPVALRHALGSTLFVEFSMSIFDIDGNKTVLAIGQDVTEKVRAHQALAVAEERYRTLIERIPDAIWTCTLDGAITFITPNATDILGYSPEELYTQGGGAWLAHVHRDDHPSLIQALRACSEGQAPLDVEYRTRRKDGHWVWIRNRATARYESEGTHYMEGMLSDVTERKRLEESFHQAQKMEAIGQLTGGIAHDFNNILSTIISSSFFLMKDLDVTDPRREDAEAIKVAAERAAALTRQLLAFSRKQVMEPRVLDLNTAVLGLKQMLHSIIGEDIRFSVLTDAQPNLARVDLGQLEQVIMNLVVNARDAMPTGGSLCVETSNIDLQRRYTTNGISVAPGRYVLLTVSDTGCGIGIETQQRIFEPFFTTKELGKGTGLGLSTCYGIVKQSGGHISVHSQPGQGTTFSVYLPRADDPVAFDDRRSMVRDLKGKETVLLVEDDRQFCSVLVRALEGYGYTVKHAADAASAMAIADTYGEQIDFILSDVVMPGMSGPELVSDLQRRFPAARVLFMSGYSDHPALKAGGLQAGVNFIQKPFTPEALAKRVREVLTLDPA